MKALLHVNIYLRLGGVSLLATLSLGSILADQLILKNGDRVTGSIIKKDGKDVTMKTDQLGTITTPWDQVVSIGTDKPVNVVLQDGRTALGALRTTGGTVAVGSQSGPLNVVIADISVIRDVDEQRAYERLQRPGWGQLWTGTGSVGFAGTSGNARTLTFTTGRGLLYADLYYRFKVLF